MFKNILMPVDLTDRHQPALDIAVRLATQSAGAVTLLHVIEIIPGLGLREEREFYSRLERAARDHLAKLGRDLAAHQVPRREEVIFGERAHEIVRYAMETGVDLIVLSSHRIDLQDPDAAWGTVSYKVGILSQCPVLLVK